MTREGDEVSVRRTDRPGESKVIERTPAGVSGPYLPLIRKPYEGYEGPLVVTEGEVAADAVLDTGYAACCWINGANAVSQTDWSDMKGDIVLWPDADGPGRDAMNELAVELRNIDCSIRIVNTSDLPERADAVDIPAEDRPEMIEDALPWKMPVPKGATELVRFRYIRGIRPPEQILPGYIERSAVSVLAGRGGTAKSLRLINETLALVSGSERIVDVEPTMRFRVAHLGLEEDTRIYTGRMVAAAEYYGIPADVIEKRLYVWEEGWHAKLGSELSWGLVDWMVDRVRGAGIDVLTADPMSFLAKGDLNSPDDAGEVMQQLGSLAKRAEIGIRIIHHAAKGGDTPHIDQVRGAGSITDHARVADLMTFEKDELSNHKVYSLGDAAKRNNMADPEATQWEVLERDKWPIMIRHVAAVEPMGGMAHEEKMRALRHLLNCAPANRRADERATGWSGVVVADCFSNTWGKPGVGSPTPKERSQEQNKCRAQAKQLVVSWLREGLIEQSMEHVAGRMRSVHTKSNRFVG